MCGPVTFEGCLCWMKLERSLSVDERISDMTYAVGFLINKRATGAFV